MVHTQTKDETQIINKKKKKIHIQVVPVTLRLFLLHRSMKFTEFPAEGDVRLHKNVNSKVIN